MAFNGGLLDRKRVVEVKIEASKGTAETSALLPMFCFDAKIETAAEFIDRKGTGAFMGHNFAGIIGDEVGVFSARIECRGNGSNALDVALAAVLTSCGFTNVAEVYSPSATIAAQKTLTVEVHEDGLLKILSGAMGNVVFSGEQGNQVFAEVEMLGAYSAVTDEAVPAFAPSTEVPPIMGSGVMTLGGDSVLIQAFGVDMGNVVTLRAGATAGALYYVITDRDPVITMNPEQDLVANHDYDGFRTGRTTKAFTLGIGSGAGKLVTFAAPAVQTRTLAAGEREGLMMYDYTGQCNISSGNDEFTVTVPTS
jgi:hypothetical protein